MFSYPCQLFQFYFLGSATTTKTSFFLFEFQIKVKASVSERVCVLTLNPYSEMWPAMFTFLTRGRNRGGCVSGVEGGVRG